MRYIYEIDEVFPRPHLVTVILYYLVLVVYLVNIIIIGYKLIED